MTPTPEDGHRARSRIGRWWWVIGIAIAAFVVIVLSPLASSDPDGLERVAGDLGFLEQARAAVFSVIPDYAVPGVDGNLSRILAGLIGVVIVFGAMILVGRLLARRRQP